MKLRKPQYIDCIMKMHHPLETKLNKATSIFRHTWFYYRPINIKIRSNLLSVRTSPRIKRKPTRYEVSVVTRDEVGAYKPYLWEQSVFDKGPMFREWLLTKIVNGERASYSAPKFARMQERTRSQMLEDIVANLQNHAETGQIPKPYRRGEFTVFSSLLYV